MSTANVGDAVLAGIVEGQYTLKQVLQVLAAVAAGKTTISAGPTVVFRDLEDSVDRVEADMTGSTRTSVTISNS